MRYVFEEKSVFSVTIILWKKVIGSFHVKWTKAGHKPSHIWIKNFQMKGIYEIRLSWKFQHKQIIWSKVMTPGSCQSMLKTNKNWRGQTAWVHFWVSVTFLYLVLKFAALFVCLEDSKVSQILWFWNFLKIYNGTLKMREKSVL